MDFRGGGGVSQFNLDHDVFAALISQSLISFIRDLLDHFTVGVFVIVKFKKIIIFDIVGICGC